MPQTGPNHHGPYESPMIATAWPSRVAQAMGWPGLIILLTGLTAARLLALVLSPSELGFDEAQYWVWSQSFAFGYFTKPPLIAWLIGVETTLCGNEAACVRAASPLLHMGTALALALLARRLYGQVAGFWSGLSYALMPGVALSSWLMTTDALLLFCWSLALLAFCSHCARPSRGAVVAFGLATGFGLLAKYAMIYLPAMILILSLADRDVRQVVFRPLSLLGVAIFMALIAPNVVWNASNDFATFHHVGGDNIGWRLSRLNATGGFEFLLAQFGVAGPILFTILLAGIFFRRKDGPSRLDRRLLWLSLPLIGTITLQGFLSQANANWAAPAYAAGVVVATALLLRHARSAVFAAHVAIGVTVSLGLMAMTAFYDPLQAQGPLRQMRQLAGWSDAASHLAAIAKANDASVIVLRGRALTAGLIHALRDAPVTVKAYAEAGTAPTNQFEMDRPWRPGDAQKGHVFFGILPKQAAALDLQVIGEFTPLLSVSHGLTLPVWGTQGAAPKILQ